MPVFLKRNINSCKTAQSSSEKVSGPIPEILLVSIVGASIGAVVPAVTTVAISEELEPEHLVASISESIRPCPRTYPEELSRLKLPVTFNGKADVEVEPILPLTEPLQAIAA